MFNDIKLKMKIFVEAGGRKSDNNSFESRRSRMNTVNSVNIINISNIVDFNAMRYKKQYNDSP